MEPQEQWKRIEGFDNYEVSDYGRIKSIKSGIMMKPTRHKSGYMIVTLCDKGTRSNKWMHVLVATAFIENPDNLPEVNHIDECKSNNKASNLEWSTRLHNVEHSLAKSFCVIHSSGVIYKGVNRRQFARDQGLSIGHFNKLFTGDAKTCKGWRLYNV